MGGKRNNRQVPAQAVSVTFLRYHKCSLHKIDVERMFEKIGESFYMLQSEKTYKIAYQITIKVIFLENVNTLQHHVVNNLTQLT